MKAAICLGYIISYLILSLTIQICVLAFALFLFCLSRATALIAKRQQQQFHSYAWHLKFNFQNVLNKKQTQKKDMKILSEKWLRPEGREELMLGQGKCIQWGIANNLLSIC